MNEIIGAMLGATIVFNIPIALGITKVSRFEIYVDIAIMRISSIYYIINKNPFALSAQRVLAILSAA